MTETPPERPSHPLYDASATGDQDTSAPRQPARRDENRPVPWLVYGIIVINLAIFLIMYTVPGTASTLINQFSVYAPAIVRDLELYRLFTGMFLHGSLAHIFFNMYALYLVGPQLEQVYGRTRFLIVYFLGGLAGSLFSTIMGDFFTPSIGASGAVFAMWAADVWHVYLHRRFFPRTATAMLRSSLIVIGGNFIIVPLLVPNIDVWGHIGGFLGGLILAYLVGPRLVITPEPASEGRVRLRISDANVPQRWALPLAIYITALISILTLATRIMA